MVTTTAHLRRGDPAFVQVEVRVDGEPARALGDAELLKIVFVNLLLNAAHAMQGRGTIHVSLTSIADICQIVFADEGPGIPTDVLEKIFTPFFTTKARGSGLGLPPSGASSRPTKARSTSSARHLGERSSPFTCPANPRP
jgi:signal transduction histidine kinase